MPVLATRVAASTWRERWSIVALALVLTGVLTYPTVPRLGQSGRLDTGDGRFSIWNVAWVAHAIVDNPRHILDANIFYPHRHTLTYSELNLVAGALAVPAYAQTHNPLAAHNSAVVASLALAFVAMWALVRRLTGSFGAGVVAAIGYTFSAYTSSHTAEIQLLMIFGFPLVMFSFHGVVDRRGRMPGVWLGAALAFTALACGYYGVFAGGLLAFATLWWAARRPGYWLALGGAALVAAALVLPVLVPYQRDRAAAGAVRTTNVEELRTYSANWRAYLTSSSDLDVKWFHVLYGAGETPKDVLFPGIVVIALAGLGLAANVRERSARRIVWGYLAIAILAGWASFGPNGGLYSLLSRVLPGMSFLRAPSRLGVVAIFGLAVLAGFGYRRLAKDRAWTWAAVGLVLAAELWVPWPLTEMPPVPRAYRVLATLPRGPVVELPFQYQRAVFHEHTKPMLMSTYHWQPLVNGYSDFIPSDFEPMAAPLNYFPDAASFEIMRARGVRYVVWKVRDYGTYAAESLARLPRYQAHLRLLADEDGIRLYEIVSWPPASPHP